MTVALYATFRALEGQERRVSELLAALMADVVKEPGNVLFEPTTLSDDPRSYFVYEVYRDHEAFDAHVAAPYGAVFNDSLRDLVEGGASTLTWLTPVLSPTE